MAGRHSKAEKDKIARMEKNTCTCDRRKRGLIGGVCKGHTTDKNRADGMRSVRSMQSSSRMASFGGRGKLRTGSNLSGGKKTHR